MSYDDVRPFSWQGYDIVSRYTYVVDLRADAAALLERYDLMGANHERIFNYKAKFAPDLRTYYRVDKRAPGMNVATKLYKRVK